MAEQDIQQPQVPVDTFATVGVRLRLAREALGLSRADVAARTKIAERHLAAIEEERFADLASSTYAVGFSRAYARSVGLDEREIAQAVRGELNLLDDEGVRPEPTFEPGDPARVPNSPTAWLAGLGALAVVAAVFIFWSEFVSPAGSLPDLTTDEAAAPPPPRLPVAAAPTVAGPVVVTAREAGVWVKITDAAGSQVYQKEMALGESFAIPPAAAEPQLRTAWPDALAITVGGRPVAPLADKRMTITAPVSAAALLARGIPATGPAPATEPAAAATPQAGLASPAPPASPARPAPAARPRPSPAPQASASVAAQPAPPPAPAAEPAAPPPAPAPADAAKPSTVSQ